MIEGRLFLLLSALVGPAILYLTIWFVSEKDYAFTIYGIIAFCIISPVCFFLLRYFWQLCWGKLILTDEYILWKCFFYKSVKIKYDDIRCLKITAFQEGNMYRSHDYYRSGFLYLLLSSTHLPQKRVDKIYSGKGIIKFPLFQRKLRTELYIRLPDPYNRYFSQYKTI